MTEGKREEEKFCNRDKCIFRGDERSYSVKLAVAA